MLSAAAAATHDVQSRILGKQTALAFPSPGFETVPRCHHLPEIDLKRISNSEGTTFFITFKKISWCRSDCLFIRHLGCPRETAKTHLVALGSSPSQVNMLKASYVTN